MAMDGSALGQKWWSDLKALQTFSPALTTAQDSQGLLFWQTVANDLIAHIKANAVVQITSATANGVTSGPATAPVTGTGAITA